MEVFLGVIWVWLDKERKRGAKERGLRVREREERNAVLFIKCFSGFESVLDLVSIIIN